MLPEAGTSPVMALHKVDLPMPLRPTTARIPWSSASETPCTTCAWPYRTLTFSSERIGLLLVVPARPGMLGVMTASRLAAHIDRLHLRIALDLGGRPVLENAAVMHDGDALDDAQRHVQIVLDQHEAHMRRKGGEQRDQLAPLARRETRRRLVEENKARRSGERHADLELPLLAVRKRGNALARDMGQPHALQEILSGQA